jgi:hypothetical protein
VILESANVLETLSESTKIEAVRTKTRRQTCSVKLYHAYNIRPDIYIYIYIVYCRSPCLCITSSHQFQ